MTNELVLSKKKLPLAIVITAYDMYIHIVRTHMLSRDTISMCTTTTYIDIRYLKWLIKSSLCGGLRGPKPETS